MSAELRCRSCGALIAPDAAWCGQCYAPVVEPGPEPQPEAIPPARATAKEASTAEPFWPCSACGGRSPIEADACVTCGTPFAALMRDEPERPSVEPSDAVVRSLVFPGLGHRLLGRPTDGLARGAVFAVSLLMALLIGMTGLHTGAGVLVFVLFLLTAVGTYVVTAIEAGRLARGGDVTVPARSLMWLVAAEVFLAVIVLAISVLSATRR